MFLFVALAAVTAWSNDGVFCVNGNHLVPVQETDIALNQSGRRRIRQRGCAV